MPELNQAVLLENRPAQMLRLQPLMNPKAEALKERTRGFFIRVIELCGTIATHGAGRSIAGQLIDSAGSTDSNYGAACKARTRKQFIDKIGIAAEEADESKRWLEALRDARLGDREVVVGLVKEANELAAIFIASHKTAQRRLQEQEDRRAAERAADRHSPRR
jgi:four helix bundle protein